MYGSARTSSARPRSPEPNCDCLFAFFRGIRLLRASLSRQSICVGRGRRLVVASAGLIDHDANGADHHAASLSISPTPRTGAHGTTHTEPCSPMPPPISKRQQFRTGADAYPWRRLEVCALHTPAAQGVSEGPSPEDKRKRCASDAASRGSTQHATAACQAAIYTVLNRAAGPGWALTWDGLCA